MAKLRSLHMKRTESRTLNHREVVEEDRRNKEPKNMEARKKRAEYVLKEVSTSQQRRFLWSSVVSTRVDDDHEHPQASKFKIMVELKIMVA